jgi:FRG domain
VDFTRPCRCASTQTNGCFWHDTLTNLPTRLLDWSEGALIALHFALKECKPVVWMLNPLDLNDLSYTTLPSRHARENSLSLGMAPAIPLSKTSVGLGSRIAAACHFRWLFIQLTFILD